MSYYIYDIDGTLADTSQRSHFVRVEKGQKKDWKSFFKAENMLADPPHPAVVNIAQRLYASARIAPVYCTGRPNNLRPPTIQWLADNVETESVIARAQDYYTHGLDVHLILSSIDERLFMRNQNDHRDDDVVKPELVKNIIELYGPPLAMFEDRARVVKAVREMGVTVFHVTDGDF